MKKIFIYLLNLCIIFAFISINTDNSYPQTPFTADSDNDGFPDDLERETGYNPNVNQALEKSFKSVASEKKKCGVLKSDLRKLGKPHNVMIILDISGSMSSSLAGKTRMEIAKNILKKYVDALPSTMKFGFVIYGKTQCDDSSIELIAPIGGLSKSGLKSKIEDLKPTGLTPIAMSLMKCIEYFKGVEDENNQLVLISDGMESCGGNPVQAIKALVNSPASPEVTVIGLGVKGQVSRHLKMIADAVKGKYADVNNEDDFINAFAGFYDKMNRFYKDIVCINSQFNSYLAFETQQYNKSKSFLMLKKMKATGDLKDALEEVEKKIEKYHKERVEAKDKLNDMIKNKMAEMEEFLEAFVGKK